MIKPSTKRDPSWSRSQRKCLPSESLTAAASFTSTPATPPSSSCLGPWAVEGGDCNLPKEVIQFEIHDALGVGHGSTMPLAGVQLDKTHNPNSQERRQVATKPTPSKQVEF